WRIASDELWQDANDRLDQTSAAYARSNDGRLLGHPESGLIESGHLLGGFCNCGVCTGTMFTKGTAPSYFTCTARHKKGTCHNKKALPEALDNQAVRAGLEQGVLNSPALARPIRRTGAADAR